MTKFWRQMNILYERVLLIVLTFLLLIVIWCMYDNYCVFSRSTQSSILKYKPGQHGVSPEESPQLDEMVAWISLDSTQIDYPIMQAGDNIKYLNTDPLGNYALSGSIFLDCRCDPAFTEPYALVYGHHMELGKMFGALDAYLDRNYLTAHSQGTLIVGQDGETAYALSVFAAANVSANENAVFNPGKEDITAFLDAHRLLPETAQSDRILALSTCTDGSSAARVVVFCYILDDN